MTINVKLFDGEYFFQAGVNQDQHSAHNGQPNKRVRVMPPTTSSGGIGSDYQVFHMKFIIHTIDCNEGYQIFVLGMSGQAY